MHAQLMRPPGQRLEREPSEAGPASHHLPGCFRRRAMRVRLHPPAARLVEFAERDLDAAFLGVGRALDHRPIGLADLALLEQLAEQCERLAEGAPDAEEGRIEI